MATRTTKAAQARAAALGADRDRIISALEEERRGYVSRGLDKRVKLIDEQLEPLKAAAAEEEKKSAKDDSGKAPTPQRRGNRSAKAAADAAAKEKAEAEAKAKAAAGEGSGDGDGDGKGTEQS